MPFIQPWTALYWTARGNKLHWLMVNCNNHKLPPRASSVQGLMQNVDLMDCDDC